MARADRTGTAAWACAVALAAALGVTACDGAADPCAAGAPGVVCQVAGTGAFAFDQDGKPALETAFYLPSQARRGPDGRLYVMDFNNQRLRVIGADGRVATIAGSGWHGFAGEGELATDSGLENPIDFDFLPDGRVVFVSYHDPRVIMIDFDGRLVVLAGTGDQGVVGDEGDGGPATLARFIELTGIAVAADGAIFVSDDIANRVRVVRDGMVFTVAGTGEAAFAGDGGPATAAALDHPTGLAVGADGALYIADYGNGAVRLVGGDGSISTVAGTGERGDGGDGGPATQAQLGGPDGVAVAADGTLYIADRDNHRVRRVGVDGVIVTVAGSGETGFAGNGGPALEADFGYLARVSLDGDVLLIADQTNSCIRSLILPD